jgi:predicted outer membrane repeat protein
VQVFSVPAAIPCRFEYCSFIENTHDPDYGGSGAAISAFYVDVYNCSFERNTARVGGAIYGAYFRIYNSLFLHNQALLFGGALSAGFKNLLINNSFLYNSANESGGAVRITGDTRDTIANCLFYENQAPLGANSLLSLFRDTLIFTHTYINKSDIASKSLAEPGIVEIYQPVFPAGNPGILTNGYLSACSPLLNRGDSTWVQRFGLEYDQKGNPRIQDALPDIGALETPQFRLSAEALPVSCFGGSDGAILPNPLGGQPPFAFYWNNSAKLNELPPGEGLLIGIDANGCADTVSLTVPQPEALWGQLFSQAATTLQMPDGQAGLQQASGGQLPYQYLWSNGNTSPQINELAPGWYQLSITDAAGCVWSDSVLVAYSVGVNSQRQGNWQVGPNPATDWLRVWPTEGAAPSGWSLRLLDARGVPLVPAQRLPETGALLPMQHLAAGVYWLQLFKSGAPPLVFAVQK